MKTKIEQFCTIRDYKPEDKNFIMATFLRGLYYGDSWFSLIPKDVFMNNYKGIAEAIINKHSVRVACLNDDSDVILGYSILSKDLSTIHWVFVKSAWRKQGLGKALLPDKPSSVTHLSKLGLQLMNKIENCVFNPFNI